MGFLIGGHDTTLTAMTWALKYLTDDPRPQSELRAQLKAAYPLALAEKRNPTVDEIIKTPIPYLDATLEEILRLAVIFPGSMRVALQDTTILGHHIPKGTDVFILHNGPGYLPEGFPVEEFTRSTPGQSARQYGIWDLADMKQFKPERWLKDGEFDPTAGPHLAFGLGPRSCFGRRLAYLDLRTILVMLMWNFEFEGCPPELSSYAAEDKLSRQAKQCYVRLHPTCM